MGQAQEKWKQLYKAWHNFKFENGVVFRCDFKNIRREAALERVIERQQREIEQLQKLPDLVNSEIWHE